MSLDKKNTHTHHLSLPPLSLSLFPLSLFLAHTQSHEGWNNSLADAVLSGFMQLINAEVRVCWGHCHWRGRNEALAACISAITVWIAWEDYMECLREPGCLILSTKNSCLGPMHLLVNRPFSPSLPSETRTFSFFIHIVLLNSLPAGGKKEVWEIRPEWGWQCKWLEVRGVGVEAP